MVKMFELTEKELVYIALSLRLKQIINLSDILFGKEKNEIMRDKINAQNSLLKKGLAQLDFEGNFSINNRVTDLMNFCESSDLHVALDRYMPLMIDISLRFYIKDDKVVQIKKKDDIYIISEISVVKVCDEMISLITNNTEYSYDEDSIMLGQLLVEELKESGINNDICNKLLEAGCTRPMIELLAEGLCSPTERFKIYIEEKSVEEYVELAGILVRDCIMQFSLEEVDYIEKIKIIFSGAKAFKKKIKDALMQFGLWEEEQFV